MLNTAWTCPRKFLIFQYTLWHSHWVTQEVWNHSLHVKHSTISVPSSSWRHTQRMLIFWQALVIELCFWLEKQSFLRVNAVKKMCSHISLLVVQSSGIFTATNACCKCNGKQLTIIESILTLYISVAHFYEFLLWLHEVCYKFSSMVIKMSMQAVVYVYGRRSTANKSSGSLIRSGDTAAWEDFA